MVSKSIPVFLFPDMSSFASQGMPSLKVDLGHAAVFEFPPGLASEPSPAVSWQAEDNTLIYGNKYAVTNDNRLVILSVDSGDEKRYR